MVLVLRVDEEEEDFVEVAAEGRAPFVVLRVLGVVCYSVLHIRFRHQHQNLLRPKVWQKSCPRRV